MIYLKTDIEKMPDCCCKCQHDCKKRVICWIANNEHFRPTGCPLGEMPGREEAKRMILEDTSEMEVERNFDEGMEALLDKLGFREGK